MPLLSIIRFFTAVISLLILGAAGYLLWSWFDGRQVLDAAGDAQRVRDDWRLWTGLALLAWSFLGRFVMLAMLARKDERPTRAAHGEGQIIAGEDRASLWVETHGPGGAPQIIMTHGWGMDSTFWNYAKRDLGDRFRLVLWDLPGLGKSKPSKLEGVSLSDFARDLATLIEVSGKQPTVLVGHSIGGMTIQTLLRDRPELQGRIAGVVLLNTTYTNPLKTMVLSGLVLSLQSVLEGAMKLAIRLQPLVWASKWQSYMSGSSHLAHRFGFGRYVTRSQLEHVTLLSTRNPPAVEAKGNLAMMRWDASDALTRLRVPALVIGGDKDIVTKLEASRHIVSENERCRLQVIEGVNHLGPMERADIYNAAIAEFALSVQPGVSDDLRQADGTTVDIPEGGPSRDQTGFGDLRLN